MPHAIALFWLVICWVLTGFGNNLRLTDLELVNSHQLAVTISWENSWRLDSLPPANHDGVWLFFKKAVGQMPFEHLPLSPAAFEHSILSGEMLDIEVSSRAAGMGVLVKRSASGTGALLPTRLLLRTQESLPIIGLEIRVFGIEMVFVPEGPFYLGDSQSNFTLSEFGSKQPFWMQNENLALAVNQTAGSLRDTLSQDDYVIQPGFPKGVAGFYCMKYEISQEQYLDFLNTLTLNQQFSRTAVSPLSSFGTPAMTQSATHRNGIRILSPGILPDKPAFYMLNQSEIGAWNQPDDGADLACNWLSWGDLSAYLCWAGLSPMTEAEFEKACRGPLYPVPLEFAWGTPEVVDANTLLQEGTACESVAETVSGNAGLASHGYLGVQGPLRCGFAAKSQTNRLEAGSSFYGIMELSGNLWEQCIRLDFQDFDGAHGNGLLNEQGAATVAGWPEENGLGAGFRGGGWNSGILPGFRDLAVSDRFYMNLSPTIRRNTSGGRGVIRGF